VSKAQELRARLGGNMLESIESGAADLASPVPQSYGETRYAGTVRLKEALRIPLDRIVPDPDQPRKEFDPVELGYLAKSLKDEGQIQPIRVRWDESLGKWKVIAGERRYRAAGLAGLATLDAVEDKAERTPSQTLALQMIENCLREDLKPIEQARAYQALMESNGWTGQQVADALKTSKATVYRVLSLLKLPEDVQARVDEGEIPSAVASDIAALDDREEQREVAARVVAEKLNRNEAREVVRGIRGGTARSAPRTWAHVVDGRVKVSVAKLAEDVTDEEVVEALKAALAARRKAQKGRAA
jgi:ParB family transcriptional regulator, chromosome partitioning protein